MKTLEIRVPSRRTGTADRLMRAAPAERQKKGLHVSSSELHRRMRRQPIYSHSRIACTFQGGLSSHAAVFSVRKKAFIPALLNRVCMVHDVRGMSLEKAVWRMLHHNRFITPGSNIRMNFST